MRAADGSELFGAQVNGCLVDLLDMPREIQETAYINGLIPYTPADRVPSDSDRNDQSG